MEWNKGNGMHGEYAHKAHHLRRGQYHVMTVQQTRAILPSA